MFPLCQQYANLLKAVIFFGRYLFLLYGVKTPTPVLVCLIRDCYRSVVFWNWQQQLNPNQNIPPIQLSTKKPVMALPCMCKIDIITPMDK